MAKRRDTEFQQGKKLTEQISAVAQVPGGLELLVSVAAEELGGPKSDKTKQLRLYNMGEGGPVKAAQGGLSQIMEQQQGSMGAQAEAVRQAGRGDDEMLLHLAPEEFEAITAMWGEPEINPETGIPEYGFLSKLWKGIKKTVKKIVKSPLFSFIAPIALNVFAPGLGAAVGGWLGATGKAAATLGNTLLRSGIGALSGGKTGAISGALSGLTGAGVGKDIGTKLGLKGATAKIAGDALLGGAAGEATGVGFKQGAIGQGMASLAGQPFQKIEKGITDWGKERFDPLTTIGMDPDIGKFSPIGDPAVLEAQADPFGLEGIGPQSTVETGMMSPVPQTGGGALTVLGDPSQGGLVDRGVQWVKDNPWLAAGGALGAAALMGGAGSDQESGGRPRLDIGDYGNFYEDLPNLSFNRQQIPLDDYYTYGMTGGEAMFFDPNTIGPGGFTDPGGGTGVLPGLEDTGGRGGRGGRGRYPRRMPNLADRTGPGTPTNMFPRTGETPPDIGYTPEPVPIISGGRRAVNQRREMADQGWTAYGGYYYPPGYFAEGTAPQRGPYGTWHTPPQPDVPAPTAPPVAQGGQSPFVVQGPYDMIRAMALVNNEGWTWDEQGKTAYPPGSFGIASARGGFVDMPQSPYSMQMQEYALGGLVRKYQTGGHVRGPGTGRSDDIPAVLSDGEFVVDSETVALLGDGSTDAGAKRLDEMRKNLRKHKAKNLAKGGFSHKAKSPEQYMAEGGEVKAGKSALRDVKRLANRLEQAIDSGNKKRVKEITSQLKGLRDGKKVLEGMAKGGSVKRIIDQLERRVDNPDVEGPELGPRERRMKERRKKQRDKGKRRRMTDKEIGDLAEELGGFKPNSAFIRRFRRELDKEKAKEKS